MKRCASRIARAAYYGGYVLDPDGNKIEAVCHQAG
jgi:hypothetical protein